MLNWFALNAHTSYLSYLSGMEKATRIYEGLTIKTNSESDTSNAWRKSQMVYHPSSNIAHCYNGQLKLQFQ